MIVVTGCGHSATLWAAVALNRLGVPCTHEVAFPPRLDRPVLPVRCNEVSWAAVPHLPGDVQVVRLVRDPVAVARSIWQRRRFLFESSSAATQFVAEHRPDITDPEDPAERIIRYVTTWDAHLAAQTVRVEDGPAALRSLANAAGVYPDDRIVETVHDELGTNVHAHVRDQPDAGGWGDDPRIADRAVAFGYLGPVAA